VGLRDDIQIDLAAAFDEDLADAVQPFSGTYKGEGSWDPVTETSTAPTIVYSGRGVMDSYDSRRIDNVNIKVGDVLLLCLANEVTDRPQVGHQITALDLITGAPVTYRVETAEMDPARAHYEIQLRRS
jgi:hypothetical protein